MQPRYLTQTSSGSGSWAVMNWHANPINLGLAVLCNGSTGYQVDVTMQDPTGTYAGYTSSTVTVFSASACAGGGIATATSSGNVMGVITQPIAALRITNNSTTGPVTLVVLQSGIG